MTPIGWKGKKPYETHLGKETAEMLEELMARYPNMTGKEIMQRCIRSAWIRMKQKEKKGDQ